ncbi:MAG: SET domain-containing protein [Calothrix sp. SM1_5_4]|nr:SET domain-containing protein [Calothrix sp. SM1_5_4]
MDNAKVKVRRTRKFGRGVFALKKIRRGETIASFDGDIFDDDFAEWTEDLLNHAIQIGKALWRDSEGIARLVNHSCEPNCGIKRRVDIVAMRDIEAGEQITFDYEMTEKSDWWRMRCRCGAPSCRKWIGSYRNLPRRQRLKYKGFISSWLLSRSR